MPNCIFVFAHRKKVAAIPSQWQEEKKTQCFNGRHRNQAPGIFKWHGKSNWHKPKCQSNFSMFRPATTSDKKEKKNNVHLNCNKILLDFSYTKNEMCKWKIVVCTPEIWNDHCSHHASQFISSYFFHALSLSVSFAALCA